MQTNTLGSKTLQFGSKTKKEQGAVWIAETRSMYVLRFQAFFIFYFLTSAYCIVHGT